MISFAKGISIAALACVCVACGGGSDAGNAPPPVGLGNVGPAACSGGVADGFACSGVALRKRVPLADMGGSGGNDIWGWADAQTGREYALVGLTTGTAFVDVTEPESPVYVGTLPTRTTASVWRDIKVYRDHAYVVADSAGAHGMQVFDLTRLRGVSQPQTFAADVVYGDFANAHNLAINEDSGFAYAVGTNTCDEGLHMVDIRTPNNPLFAGCHTGGDTHDAQCVNYAGPDADHAGSEICINSNSNHVEIADVSDKAGPFTVSAFVYPQLGFVHQGWLTEDHRFLFIGDEFDELSFGVPTRTHVIDLTDLDNPSYLYPFENRTASVDHNLYVLGNRVFQSNYESGLRVLEFADLASGEIGEIAYFDTYPQGEAASFEGTWSVYPYLPSGNIVINDASNGLFILTLQ